MKQEILMRSKPATILEVYKDIIIDALKKRQKNYKCTSIDSAIKKLESPVIQDFSKEELEEILMSLMTENIVKEDRGTYTWSILCAYLIGYLASK